MTESLPLKWLRRYKWFFGLVVLILIIQLFLANYLPTFSNRSHSGAGPSYAARSHYSSEPSTTPTSAAESVKKYQLRHSQLSSDPGCDIHTKDAVSAIHRATTLDCKQTIANITCAIQAGTFYPAHLPNSCPNGNFISNREHGCFRDQKKPRLLAGYFTTFKQLNTPGKCIQLCLQSGFLYAGVQFGTECFCGNNEPDVASKVPDEECNYSCVGEPSQICGGYFRINVYETGISKFVAQTADLTTDASANDVRIAFLLTLNGRAVRQVHRLLKALYSPKHFYFIHVDSRQDYLYHELLQLESHAPNIRLARNRFSTIWGGASLLTMLLASMNSLLALPWHWDFVINLSESDFPVKTVDKLAEFLSANRDRNFVKSHGREVQRFIQKQGLDKTFVECDTHMWRIGDRTLPNGVQIDGGSDWVALSRPFVEYVAADEKDTLVEGLLKVFRHTLLPAESFFHTAIRNSKFCNTYVDNNLHVTNWKRRLGCKCQYKHVVDWCGCSPNDFKPDDWPRLLQTEGKQVFFARKFEPIINQAVILKLETWLYGHLHLVDVPNIYSYWQNVYCHKDSSPKADDTLLQVTYRILLAALYDYGETEVHKVLNIYVYMDKDVHRGMIIHANVSLPGFPNTEIEVWTRHDQLPQASRSLPVGKRISRLEVSSDFDQKEQVARNFVQILGQNSEPTVVMHLRETVASDQATQNCTVLWISPAGLLADVSEMHIEDSTTGESIHFSKSNLKPPLLPGIWTAKVLYQKGVVGKCEFMITPMLKLIPLTESALLDQEHSGKVEFSQFLPNKTTTKLSIGKALEHASLFGADRLNWIDRLIQRFFSFKDICAKTSLNSTAFVMTSCASRNWSSMAVDPKSDIYADLERWLR